MKSEAVENYLKAIYASLQNSEKVTTSKLAQYIGVSSASATSMIKKLDEMKLVHYKPYYGVSLTDAGMKVALETIRHHRLLELYLSEALGVSWDKVHDEAERWEHVLSEDLEDRIDAILGHPTSDPHGSPIPMRDGSIPSRNQEVLVDLQPGKKAFVTEVSDHDPEILRYFTSLGIGINAEIKVIRIEPFEGPLTILINNAEYSIGRKMATLIYVSVTPHKLSTIELSPETISKKRDGNAT
ncbi:metal-dependent transcriptional regulator [bacterium AH-315-E10]|nr:metal-dependent transcriptional regulator [bacterium AH-315-E10]